MSAKDLLIKLFSLPKGEIIFQDYSCALKSLISKYGRIFIAENHICFYANLAGSKTIIVLKLDDIQKIENKSKSEIEIILKDGKNYCFHGFNDKDQVFNLMNALFSGQPISGTQTFSSETTRGENEDSQIENAEVEITFLQTTQNIDQEICKFTFPFNVDKYFEFFVADDASVYSLHDHRVSEKDTDIQITKWSQVEDQPGKFQREMKNVIKLSGVPFKDKSRMHKLQFYEKTPEKLVYTSTTYTLDVPYGNCFQAEERWEVTPFEETKCLLKIFASVVFTKSTMMKNTIISRTLAGLKEDYERWINNVKSKLEILARPQQKSIISANHEFEDSKNLDNSNILERIKKNTSTVQKTQQQLPQQMLLQKEVFYVFLIIILIMIMLVQIILLNKQSNKLDKLEQMIQQLQQQ